MFEIKIYEDEGRFVTDSLNLAGVFDRNHRDILEAIRNLECSEEFRLRNFTQSSYQNEQNKEQPMYTMTRDGWAFLAMGFTGAKAAMFKEAYISAFNRMELALTCPKSSVLLKANSAKYIPQKTNIELLKEWLEAYTLPLHGRGPALSVDMLHRLVNGWLLANRYKRLSKRDLQVYMEILRHRQEKIDYFPSYHLRLKEEMR